MMIFASKPPGGCNESFDPETGSCAARAGTVIVSSQKPIGEDPGMLLRCIYCGVDQREHARWRGVGMAHDREGKRGDERFALRAIRITKQW